MADTDLPPRFFKVFISQFSSDSMLIPLSYYDHLPSRLPKTVILQGIDGGIWNVPMKLKQDEVFLGQGWSKFVRDNSLSDGEFLTFVYNGDSIFEVSIYRHDGCKEIKEVSEVDDDDEEDSVGSLSSEDTNTCSDSEMDNAIPRSKNKGKSKEEVVDDFDEEEDSVYSLSNEDTETDTCSEMKTAKSIPRSMNKGKKKKEVVKSSDEDSDSDYIEAFGGLDFEEKFNSDGSYSPDSEEAATYAKPKVTNAKKKGKSKVIDDADAIEVEPKVSITKKEKSEAKIENPEAYLDDPKNLHFQTTVKNRKYELLVHAQLVRDYCLKFQDCIKYIDEIGRVEAKTARWSDQRVCIKKWDLICERNELKKGDRILCEIFRKKNLVCAIKIHIIR